jgi:hypothetical protein
MTNEQGNPQSTNVVFANRNNINVFTKKVETATNVYPGRLVMRGTNDDDVIVCDGSTAAPEGWTGYEDTPRKWKPATISTVYAQNDQIAVARGPGIKVRAALNAGATVTVGMLLKASTVGTLTPGVAGTDDIVAQAAEAVTTDASTISPIMVWSRI